jgi:hypothetical protein
MKSYATIIAGSRGVLDYQRVRQAALDAPWLISLVISGGARGVDLLGERFAREFDLPILQFIPDWQFHGRRAGVLRNIEMAKVAGALVAVWDGASRGTEHMISAMKQAGKPVFLG